MPAFATMPGHLIRRAQQIAVALFVEECATVDLTPVQFAVLTSIESHPGIDATRLAGLAALDKPSTGGVVDRLEAKGLVARATADTDRRVKHLTITAAGKRLLRRAEPAVAQTQTRLLAPLSEHEQQQLVALLSKLVSENNEASRAPHRPLATRQKIEPVG